MDHEWHDTDGNLTPDPSSGSDPDDSQGFEPVIRSQLRKHLSSLNQKCRAATLLSAHLLTADQMATWANKLMVLYERVDRAYADLRVRGFFQNSDQTQLLRAYDLVMYGHRFLIESRERQLEKLEPSQRKTLVALDQPVAKPKDFAPYATRSTKTPKTNNTRLLKTKTKQGEKGRSSSHSSQPSEQEDSVFAFGSGRNQPVRRSPINNGVRVDKIVSTNEQTLSRGLDGPPSLEDTRTVETGTVGNLVEVDTLGSSSSGSSSHSSTTITSSSHQNKPTLPNLRPNLADPLVRKRMAEDVTASLRTPPPTTSLEQQFVFMGTETNTVTTTSQPRACTSRDAHTIDNTNTTGHSNLSSDSDFVIVSSSPRTQTTISSSTTQASPSLETLKAVCNQVSDLERQLAKYRRQYDPSMPSEDLSTGRNVPHISFSLPPPPLGIQSSSMQIQTSALIPQSSVVPPQTQMLSVPSVGAHSTVTSSLPTGQPLLHAPLPRYPPSSSVFPPISTPIQSIPSTHMNHIASQHSSYAMPVASVPVYTSIYPSLPPSTPPVTLHSFATGQSPYVSDPQVIPQQTGFVLPSPTFGTPPPVVSPQPSSMGSNTTTLIQMLMASQQSTNKLIQDMISKPKASASSHQRPPEVKTEIFNGNINEYAFFKTNFKHTVDCFNFSNEAKALRLYAALQGEPRHLVSSLVTENNLDETTYQQMWDILEAHYGGMQRLNQTKLEKLHRFGKLKDMSKKSLFELLVVIKEVVTYCRQHAHHQLSDKGSLLLIQAKAILGDKYGRHYIRFRNAHNYLDCLETYLVWLESAANEANELDMLAGNQHKHKPTKQKSYKFEQSRGESDSSGDSDEEVENVFVAKQTRKQKRDYGKSSKHREKDSSKIDTTASNKTKDTSSSSSGKPSSSSSGKPNSSSSTLGTCSFCGRTDAHKSADCPKLKDMSLKDKYKIVRNKRLCFHCLYGGHRVRDCKVNRGKLCEVDGCERYHNPALHPPESINFFIEDFVDSDYDEDFGTEQNCHTYNMTGPKTVAIQTVNCFIKIGDVVKPIMAIIDSGSNSTNIDLAFAELLGAEETLQVKSRQINFLDRKVTVHSKQVKFELVSQDGASSFKVLAWTVKDFASGGQCLDWHSQIKEFDHLKDLDIPPNPYPSIPTVLIGVDYSHFFRQLETRTGDLEDPMAVRTILGWSILGRYSGDPEGYILNSICWTNIQESVHAIERRDRNHSITSSLRKTLSKHSKTIKTRVLCQRDDTRENSRGERWEESDRKESGRVSLRSSEKEKKQVLGTLSSLFKKLVKQAEDKWLGKEQEKLDKSVLQTEGKENSELVIQAERITERVKPNTEAKDAFNWLARLAKNKERQTLHLEKRILRVNTIENTKYDVNYDRNSVVVSHGTRENKKLILVIKIKMNQDEDDFLQLHCYPPEYDFGEEQATSNEDILKRLSGPLRQRLGLMEGCDQMNDDEGLLPQRFQGYYGPKLELRPMESIDCIRIPSNRLEYLRTPRVSFRAVPPLVRSDIETLLTNRGASKLMMRRGHIYGRRRLFLDVAIPPFPEGIDQVFEATCREFGYFSLDTEGQPEIASLQLGAPTGEVLVFPNFKPEQLSHSLRQLIADPTIAKIQSGISSDAKVLANHGIPLQGGVEARCIWKAWIPRDPGDACVNQTGLKWLSEWLGPAFPYVQFKWQTMTFKDSVLPEDEFHHVIQDVRYPLAGLYKTALLYCDANKRAPQNNDNIIPVIHQILQCHQGHHANGDRVPQVFEGETVGLIPCAGVDHRRANSALTVYKLIDSARFLTLVRDYCLPPQLRPLPQDDFVSGHQLAAQALKFWTGHALPNYDAIKSYDRGFALKFCEACGDWDHHQHKVDFCQPGLTFDPCRYPLCWEKESHALQVCPYLGGICDYCKRRGHALRDHEKYSPLDLDYTFLWWAPCHMVTSLPFLELTDQAPLCCDYLWRASLYNCNRNVSQRLLALYDIPYVALPPSPPQVTSPFGRNLAGPIKVSPPVTRRRRPRRKERARPVSQARKAQRLRTDPSKTYQRFLKQKIPAPSELPSLPPMELQAWPALPAPSSFPARSFSRFSSKRKTTLGKKSVKERLGKIPRAETITAPDEILEEVVQPPKKSVKDRLGVSRRETTNPQ